MFDTLPFPNMTAKDAEERSKQTIDYLLQLREELVFILDSIVTGEYGKLTTQVTQTTEVIERVANSSSENSLTVAEVINSAAFRGAINGVKESIPKEIAKQLPVEIGKQLPTEVAKQMPDITFNVNYDNGYLEYTIK